MKNGLKKARKHQTSNPASDKNKAKPVDTKRDSLLEESGDDKVDIASNDKVGLPWIGSLLLWIIELVLRCLMALARRGAVNNKNWECDLMPQLGIYFWYITIWFWLKTYETLRASRWKRILVGFRINRLVYWSGCNRMDSAICYMSRDGAGVLLCCPAPLSFSRKPRDHYSSSFCRIKKNEIHPK